MAADFSIKSHDLLPPIQAALLSDAVPVDLTTALSVKFIMKLNGGTTTKINSAAVVVDAINGLVRYDWKSSDTDTPGNYQAEWEVTWPGPKKQTFPTLTYHSIAVLADLDGA